VFACGRLDDPYIDERASARLSCRCLRLVAELYKVLQRRFSRSPIGYDARGTDGITAAMLTLLL
jgi:hypothetical protein